MTQEQRIAYESRLKRVLDELAARVLREQEAEERGEKVGKERGEKIGIELGKQEEKETIALSLLKKGLDIDTIVEVTGLDKQRLREINEESR